MNRRPTFFHALFLAAALLFLVAAPQSPAQHSSSPPAEYPIPNSPLPIRILVQSPADTKTDLQVICLFHSDPANTLHGSLLEVNEKLDGFLDRLRAPSLFRGDLGETLLLTPPAGTLGAQHLLLVGLGDSENFSPDRMNLVGAVVFREANLLGVAHPFFAPTVLDGGVTRFSTGAVATPFVEGFLRAARTQSLLQSAKDSRPSAVRSLTYLAGAKHASDTKQGIEAAIASSGAM